jgi:hypothetical protein
MTVRCGQISPAGREPADARKRVTGEGKFIGKTIHCAS